MGLRDDMGTEIEEIKQELTLIRKELQIIREELPDRDMFLTAEESQLVDESYQHEKEGKLISSAALRKELGV